MQAAEHIKLARPVSTRHEPYKRGETMVELIVECRPATQGLSGGHLLNKGLNRIQVLSTALPDIMAQVEDEPEEIAAAERSHARALAKHVKDGVGDESQYPDADELRKKQNELRDTFAVSVASEFQRATGRDMKPLISVLEVVRDIPVDVDIEAKAHELSMARLLANAVNARDGAGAQATGFSMDEIKALLAAQAVEFETKLEAAVAKALEEERATRPATPSAATTKSNK
jgi:hypothetical protein